LKPTGRFRRQLLNWVVGQHHAYDHNSIAKALDLRDRHGDRSGALLGFYLRNAPQCIAVDHFGSLHHADGSIPWRG